MNLKNYYTLFLLCVVGLFPQAQTPSTLQLVKDINLGNGNSDASDLTNFNGKTYFIATDGHKRHLYETTGTAASTRIVVDSITLLSSGSLAVWNNHLYFTTARRDTLRGSLILLYRTNGLTVSFVDTLLDYKISNPRKVAHLQRLFVENNTLHYDVTFVGRSTSETFLGRHNGQRNGARTIALLTKYDYPLPTELGATVFYGSNDYFFLEGGFAKNAYFQRLRIVNYANPAVSRTLFLITSPTVISNGFQAMSVLGDKLYLVRKDTLLSYNALGVRQVVKTGIPTPKHITRGGNNLYFADFATVWKTDGTAGGTMKIPFKQAPNLGYLSQLYADDKHLIVITNVVLGRRDVSSRVYTLLNNNVLDSVAQENNALFAFFANGKAYFTSSISNIVNPCAAAKWITEIGNTIAGKTLTQKFIIKQPNVNPCQLYTSGQVFYAPNHFVYYKMSVTGFGLELWKVNLNPPAIVSPALAMEKVPQFVPILFKNILPTLTDGAISIELESSVEKIIHFNFYDLFGKRVKSEARQVVLGENHLNFDFSNEMSGVYLVQTDEGTGQSVPLKFVKL